LIKVAKKLPFLEELDISFTRFRGHSFEVIGQFCPLLKSLKSSKMFLADFECNDEAFAIAKTMPGLRHLNIYANQLTDAGLIAILDGCPLLKSLNLGRCYNLVLSRSLEQRCCEHVKDVIIYYKFQFREVRFLSN
jgi:hypothetical protein